MSLPRTSAHAHKNHKIDMTSGSIMRLVVLFALPICLGNILQQLYTTVDTIVIGRYCSAQSLAAVGTSSQPVELLLNLFLGIGGGISILVAQYVGSGDNASLNRLIHTSTTFLYVIGLTVSILGLFVGPLVLIFMQCPADTYDLAVLYIRIVFLGSLGNIGYNLNAGILRGLGDSAATLMLLMISCFVNIVLDIVFVGNFKMDVAGAALATSVALFASWVGSIIYIKKKYSELNFPVLPKSYDRDMLGNIIRIGLPLGLNNSIYSIGHILLQTLVNAQGSIFIAGCSVGTKVNGIANVAITSFSSACTTFAGQNLGAKKYKRLKKGGYLIPFSSGAFTLTMGILFLLFCTPVLSVFTKDAEVLSVATQYMRIVLPSSWIYAIFNGIICYANGLGEVRYPTVVNILMLWAVRIPTAYFIAEFIGGEYIMACFPVSFTFGCICMLFFYRSKRWRNVCRLAKEG